MQLDRTRFSNAFSCKILFNGMYYTNNIETKNEASKIVQLRDSNFGWTPKFSIGLCNHVELRNLARCIQNSLTEPVGPTSVYWKSHFQ